MISWMPPKADALHLRSELKIDGRYLNMDVNEMEPLAEVWHAALAVSKEAGGWMSVRLHSADLLQLNLTYELQRTLEQLRNAAQAGDAAGLAKRKTGDGELTECKVRDCASGDSGCKTLAEHIGAPDRSNEPPPSPAQGFGRGGTRYMYVPTASLLQMSRTKSTVISVRLVEERRPRDRQYFNLDAFRDGTNAHAHDAVRPKMPLVWAPPLQLTLSQCRLSAHRVWRRGDSNLPHAVLMTDVKPNDEAGKTVTLRSNVTLRNTLLCDAYVLLERLPAHASDHSPGTSGVLKVGQTFHVPLHLTNRTKLHVRPAGVAANHPPTVDDASGLIAKREEKRPWFTGSNADLDDPTSNLLPEAVEWLRDSPATIVLDAAQIGRRVNNPHTTGKFEPLDPTAADYYPLERPDEALVCLHRQCEMVSNQVWGEVPDVTISFLPKFTLENRLPVSLDYRLACPTTRRAAVAVPAADADADDAPASGAAAAAAAADEGGGADAAEPRVNPLVKLLLPLLRRGDGDGAATRRPTTPTARRRRPRPRGRPELPDVLRQLVVQHAADRRETRHRHARDRSEARYDGGRRHAAAGRRRRRRRCRCRRRRRVSAAGDGGGDGAAAADAGGAAGGGGDGGAAGERAARDRPTRRAAPRAVRISRDCGEEVAGDVAADAIRRPRGLWARRRLDGVR